MAITVRPLRPGEERMFLELHARSVRGLATGHYAPDVIEAWTVPLTDENLRGLVENRDNEVRLIAELEGEPVGLGVLVVDGSELRACYVVPEAARKGVGRALVREIERIATANGLERLELLASVNAEPFYASLGYLSEGRTEHTLRTGHRMAAVRMVKPLRGAHPSRRTFISAAIAMIPLTRHAIRQTPRARRRTRLVLLGTGGGPRPRKNSFSSSQVIVVNDSAYIVDCGDGVATQLVRAGVALSSLRHVFITHQHSDHNADYGNLLLLAWESGLRTRVDTWGPPPMDRMTRLFFEMNAYNITTRIADEGRTPLAPLVHAHELTGGGEVVKDEHVTVTCAVVDHPPVVPSFAYRFDTPDRSIVISGDTKPSEQLVRLAHGADILVHEALYPEGVDRLVARVPNAPALKQSIMSHHTTAADAGRIATAAGVKMLVLSHLVPPDDPAITDRMWIDAARSTFKGQVVVGRDLLEI